MTTNLRKLAAALAIAAITTAAHATPIIATATLDSRQERDAGVASTSPALGAALLTVEPTTGEYDFSLQITGIAPSDLADLGISPAISSIHLHNAPAGSNGQVVVDLGGGSSNVNVTPFGNGGLSVNVDGGFFGGTLGNTLVDSNRNLASLFLDELYINVHTNDFRGGEIRGQLSIVQQQVPEPTSIVLSSTLAVCGLVRRRAR